MPLVATDLEYWGPLNTPDDDTSAYGGAMQDDAAAAGGKIPFMVDLAATDDIEAVSDGADVRVLTFEGRVASGALDTDSITLTGATPAQDAAPAQYERALRATLASKDAARTVTVRRAPAGATVATLTPNTIEAYRLFRKAASSASQTIRYELVYCKNANGAGSALTEAVAQLFADPAEAATGGNVDHFFAVATAKGNLTGITDRTTNPGGLTFVDEGTTQAVPGNVLSDTEFCGAWIRQTLAASAAPQKNTVTVRFSGIAA